MREGEGEWGGERGKKGGWMRDEFKERKDNGWYNGGREGEKEGRRRDKSMAGTCMHLFGEVYMYMHVLYLYDQICQLHDLF